MFVREYKGHIFLTIFIYRNVEELVSQIQHTKIFRVLQKIQLILCEGEWKSIAYDLFIKLSVIDTQPRISTFLIDQNHRARVVRERRGCTMPSRSHSLICAFTFSLSIGDNRPGSLIHRLFIFQNNRHFNIGFSNFDRRVVTNNIFKS